jgi:hypothetical protein
MAHSTMSLAQRINKKIQKILSKGHKVAFCFIFCIVLFTIQIQIFQNQKLACDEWRKHLNSIEKLN